MEDKERGKMKTRLYLTLAASAVIGLAVAQPASAKLDSCDGPIVLGTTLSESGVFSTLADRWRNMTKIFAEEVNKRGGVQVKDCNKGLPIEFVMYDDQSVPATAVSLYERLASVDKVDFLVGPDWSSIGGPVSAVAERHKVPIVMANVATPSIYERGFKYVWGTPAPVVPRWSERYFEMLAGVDPKPKTIYFITEDNPVMKGITTVWSKKVEDQGLKVVGSEMFSSTQKDFTAVLAKVRSLKPDIIYVSSFDGASVPLVQQMAQMQIKAMDIHHTMLTGSLERQVGADIEGWTGELVWYQGVKGDYSDLIDTVLERSKVDMFDYIWTLARLNSYLVIMQAIEKAGAVDREKVKAALYRGTFKSPAGDIVFDENGFPNTGAFTIQLQDGKPVVVWPKDVATGQLRWPATASK
ncbi:amino acid ABC transporter substrate-binding protein [Castellaniella sp. GW247-6E4]|uniref:amino acid ABC transporter substrate-binding protein n=1 Tax=Castellaniella sp. GW247-6E4 TaxID=3140380 RepID=UPI003315DD95